MLYASVEGRIARSGRRVQRSHQGVVGIIPLGRDQYAGLLETRDGKRLPVTWDRHWSGERGDPLTLDPVNGRPHRFRLLRLSGARYWYVADWSGKQPDPNSYLLTPANCLAELGPRPNDGSPGAMAPLPPIA
jgi:hypothetical protein